MFVKEKLYALGDVTVIPDVVSNIRHRSECNVWYNNKKYDNTVDYIEKNLGIFVSPMASVINKENFNIWANNGLVPILPRTETTELRLEYAKSDRWAAFSLAEFEEFFCDHSKPIIGNIDDKEFRVRVLIDMANGHIKHIQDMIIAAKSLAKEFNYEIEIMAGNIANPETYKQLAVAGADYVRCAVGSGGVCITASNTSAHYPMASLIDECKKLKNEFNLTCGIVADGGINSYANAIKALALGADYVMMGSTLAKCFESAGEIIKAEKPLKDYTAYSLYNLNNMRWDNSIEETEKKEIIKMYAPMCKTIFGMSTRKAQTLISLAKGIKKQDIKTKTSEGIEKEITVDYTVKQWVENFQDYLRSAMSYCNFTDIKDFVGGPLIMLLSESAKSSINK